MSSSKDIRNLPITSDMSNFWGKFNIVILNSTYICEWIFGSPFLGSNCAGFVWNITRDGT